jgi:NAD(P)-dependent dehydrogenase (short-subunit alcohol dehydrogenase family)
MSFQDRHVVVTGGAGALGIAVVAALLDAGATCHVPTHSDTEAQQFPFRDHDRIRLVANCDLTDDAAVARLYADVPKLWASIHLAGGFFFGAIGDTSPADLKRQFDINFLTSFLCCRAAVGAMMGSTDGGRIVNVAARSALEPRLAARMTAYGASKAAVAALTAALAEEVVSAGILVNAVAPSTLDTPANRNSMPDADFTQWPKVEEVAATILYLASPNNHVTRGAVVPVYGRA